MVQETEEGIIVQQEKNYYPFGLQHQGYNSTISGRKHNYGYNGIELNEDVGLYEMDLRQYDPAIARWTAIDPVTHHSMSTYTAFDNNPVFWADPSGADGEMRIQDLNGNWHEINSNDYTTVYQASDSEEDSDPQDDITVNSEGIITNVVKNGQPNRFFDEKGNELFFNDPGEADTNNLKPGRYAKGDRLFFGISSMKLNSIINGSISYFDLVLALARKKSKIPGDFANIALDSHGNADFTHSYLIWEYLTSTERSYLDVGVFRSSFISDQHYFRFGNDNTLYNLYDAGNFMWGNRARKIGLSLSTSLRAAKVNSIITLNGFDTKADQNSIRNGFNFK